MKTFIEYLEAQDITEQEMIILTESLNSEWTPELEAKVDYAIEQFFAEYEMKMVLTTWKDSMKK